MENNKLVRGKKRASRAWIEGVLAEKDGNPYIVDRKKGKAYPIDLEPICSYSGFKDNNNKRIFEGDIIHDSHYAGRDKRKHYYKAICQDGVWGMRNIFSGSFQEFEDFTFSSEAIIGDVYTNHDLLKWANYI